MMNRVLHVAPFYPPHLGGLENHVEILSREQAALGMDVTVLTSNGDGTLPDDGVHGRRVIRLPSLRTDGDSFPRGMLSSLGRLRRDHDVVHLHGHHFYSTTLGAIHRRYSRMPTVMTFHGDYVKTSPMGRGIKQLRDMTQGKIILGAMDRIIALTAHDKAQLVRKGARPDRVTIIPNGVDLSVFEPLPEERINGFKEHAGIPEGSRLVLFVGRHTEQKGLRYLIDAVPDLVQEVPDVHVFIAGTGNGMDEARSMVQALGVDGSVTVNGHLSSSNLVNAYNVADAVAVPSLWEGMPLVILEAAACGTPVVASSVSGIPEFVEHGRTGLLVPPKDPEAMAASLAQALNDDRFSSGAGYRALAKARKEFDLKVQVQKTLDAYEGVVDDE
jgi:glycosyltransferase involved in cell wall biosynthesis